MFQDIITKTTVSNTGNHMTHQTILFSSHFWTKSSFWNGNFFYFQPEMQKLPEQNLSFGQSSRLPFTAKIIDVIFLTYYIYIPFDGHSILRPMLFENK